MTIQEENAYIAAVLNGNTQSYTYLINRYKGLVYTLCLKIVKNQEDAEEIAQDVFLKAYQQLANFRQESKFSTWLYKIAYHTSLNKIKRKKIWKESIDMENEDHPSLQIEDTTFEGQFETLSKAEQKKYLQLAVDSLQKEDAGIITLFYFAENSIEEISEITGIEKNNVKVKLHRARKKLYQRLSLILKDELQTLIY